MPLHVLTASQLPTRDAARAFVAGPDFGALLRACGSAACPAGDVPAALLERARSCASFLLDDLAAVARAATGESPEPLTDAPEHDPVSLAADLGALLAVALVGDPMDAAAMAEAIERAQGALRDRRQAA